MLNFGLNLGDSPFCDLVSLYLSVKPSGKTEALINHNKHFFRQIKLLQAKKNLNIHGEDRCVIQNCNKNKSFPENFIAKHHTDSFNLA